MLLGAAKLLKAREGQLQGTVLLVFQPAEEGGAGAQAARLLLAAAGVDPLQQAVCAAAAPAAAGSCAACSGCLLARGARQAQRPE